MSEFKVGDRVRILADSCIKGCEADVVEIEQDRVTISCGVFSGCFNKDGLELVNKNKKPPTLEQLEQRIEKLEKCVMGEQNSLEKCENVLNKQNNEQNKSNNWRIRKISAKNEEIISKLQLLTEDDLPTHNRINELEDLKYFRDKGYIWTCKDENGAIHIFKIKPTIYNIEELLKGEDIK